MIPATIEYRGPWMLVHFRGPQDCVSWALANGGRVRSACVAWYYIEEEELPELAEPASFLETKLQEADLRGSVVLVTGRKRYGLVEAQARSGTLSAWCAVTVGLRNAVHVGDEAYELPPAGTINLLCWVSRPLTIPAELEAISIAAEARTSALLELGQPSVVSKLAASGTGTDCIVIAHPGGAQAAEYAGKRTDVGHVVGKAVYDAVRRGAAEWIEEFGSRQRS